MHDGISMKNSPVRADAFWVIAAGLLVWTMAVRLPFGLAPRADADAALFWLIGHGWRTGIVPYAGLWDIKPPGIFLIFAGADALFGADPLGGRIMAALAIGTGSAGLYRAGDRLLDDRRVGLFAALLFPVYSLLFDGLANKPELFCAPLVIWGLLLAAQAVRSDGASNRGLLFTAGLLLGFAAMIKQTAAFEILFVVILLGLIGRTVRATVPMWAVFGAGLAFAPLGFAAYFAAVGAFTAFFDASVVGALLRLRGDGVALADAPVRVLASLKTGMPLLVLAGLGWAERRRLAWNGHDRAALVVWGWLAAAALGELAMRATYPAYALPLVAPLCLLSARPLAALTRARSGAWRIAGGVACVIALLWPLAFRVFTRDPDIDLQAPRVAAYLRERVPGQPVYVVDYDPVVYQLSGAPVLTRFPFHQHIVCDFPALPVSPEAEIRRIMAARPAALVFAPENHRMVCELPERVGLVRALARAGGYAPATRIAGDYGEVEIWTLSEAAR